ncbi:MAG: hypothetical protein D8M52_08810 [Chlorobi bacterium]|nr:MAG: hypothetical protein UZ06_CHB003001983 [Chlorobi bacterium OLB6]MBL1161802.1 hypothetical protein [Chlorobiota bacterium]
MQDSAGAVGVHCTQIDRRKKITVNANRKRHTVNAASGIMAECLVVSVLYLSNMLLRQILLFSSLYCLHLSLTLSVEIRYVGVTEGIAQHNEYGFGAEGVEIIVVVIDFTLLYIMN